MSRPRSAAVWNHFAVQSLNDKTAVCNYCKKTLSYRSTITNLKLHLKQKHKEVYEEFCRNLVSNSGVGSHFKCMSTKLRISMCLICNERLSTLNIDYLKKHLMIHHPHINLPDDDSDVKNILLTDDGQIYEVEQNDAEDQNDDDEKDNLNDNMNIDAVYLDDYVVSSPEPPVKRPRIRKHRRPRLRTTYTYKQGSDSSEEMPTPVQKREKCKEDDALEHFGTYLVCLMRQLPKNVSNQLQTSFVKQIMDAQSSCEHQEAAVTSQNNSYTLAVAQHGPGTGTDKD